MIFLNKLNGMDLARVVCYPDDIPRLDRNTAIIIPTNDEGTFYEIATKLKAGRGNFRIKNPRGVFIPKTAKFKVGKKTDIYKNKTYSDDVALANKNGFHIATYSTGLFKDYNMFFNYCKIINEFFVGKMNSGINTTIWKTVIDFKGVQHEKRYILFCPELVNMNIRSGSSIVAGSYKFKDPYISFLWNLKWHKSEMINLLKNNNCKLIWTDWKMTFVVDYNSDTRSPDEIYDNIFQNIRKMAMGKMAGNGDEVEYTEALIDAVAKTDEENLEAAIRIQEELEKKEKPISGISNKNKVDSLKLSKKEEKESKAIEAALAVTKIIEDSKAVKQKVPVRQSTLEKRQSSIKERNLTEIMAKMEMMADNVLKPDTLREGEMFGEFSIQNMDQQYEEVAKKDRIEIAESLNKNSIPLFLTNYKEEKNMTSKDTNSRKVQMTFESPDNPKERHTFTVDIPELKDGKFLHIGGSDKVMIRQKMALPIIKLEDSVCFTTYYNKMFITHSTGNYNKVIFKIRKFIRWLRKEYPTNELKQWFSFTPAYFKAKKENKLSPELLEIGKFFEYMKIDENNWIDLSGNPPQQLAMIDGTIFSCNYHDDVIFGENGKDTNVMNVFHTLANKLPDKDMVNMWNTIAKSKASDAMVYSRVKVLNQNIPLIYILLQTFDENLLDILEILKNDYGLQYQITSLSQGEKPNKKYDRDDTDRFLFKNFYLDITYKNIPNRCLLTPLNDLDLTSYDSLLLKGIIDDIIPSSNTVLYLENFRDLFIDPITKQIMEDCGMPSNYGEALIYANSMMSNYDRTRSDISLKNERMPSNAEIIEGALYKAISNSYQEWSVKKKRGAKNAAFSIEKNAIIKILSTLPNVEESSKINPVQHVDKSLTISNKGLSGINNDRSYTVPKRRWDKSFYGTMSDVSPYGPKTGVTNHLAVNPNITDIRGYFKDKEPEDVTPSEAMSVSEALGTFSQKHDSSPRTAMGMMQFNHLMGAEGSEPSLVTYGMDEMMASLDTDFSKRLADDAEVLMINDKYLKLRYPKVLVDGKSYEEVIHLDAVERNSAKAFFIPNTLVLNSKLKLKKGSKIPKNTIVAYNPNFYQEFGSEIVFKSGPIVNVAIHSTQYAYEDATVLSESLAKKLQTKILKRIAVKVSPRMKIFEAKLSLGKISAGDVLIKVSEDSGSEYLNAMYDSESLNDYLMRVKKSNYNGVIKDIFVYYKLSQDDKKHMDPSIKKFMTEIDKYYRELYNGSELAKNLPAYAVNKLIDHVTEFTDNRNNKVNGDIIEKGEILIEYFIEINKNFSSGDKITIGNTALKGVTSKIFPDNKMPVGVETGKRYDLILSTFSPLKRMIYSTFLNGVLTQCMQKMNNDIRDIIKKHKK